MNPFSKICFVIMGFGKKQDYSTNRSLDLDKTYKNIIKPAAEKAGLTCIRADEVKDSAIIDSSMYALIMKAEVVIADITTYNPNVLYELGVRHAVRPFSTIILREESCSLPFDLNHTRIFTYKHLGDDIGTDESQRCQKELYELIDNVLTTQNVDSPLYEYLRLTTPPVLNENEYAKVLDELINKEQTVFAFVEKARDYMNNSNSGNNKFEDAAELWARAEELIPAETYFTQQRALCIYKSQKPSPHSALCNALGVIDRLNPSKSNDTETLGIAGAICRRLYEMVKDMEYLDRAISHYKRGYELHFDYYTGENYAFCLDLKRVCTEDYEEKVYYKVEANKTRTKISSYLEKLISEEDFNKREDKKWIYASLSNCSYSLGEDEKGGLYEDKFTKCVISPWEKETFELSKQKILSFRKI